MTTVWALTWLGQSAALAALTAAFVRLPGCRSSAAGRHVAWTLGLFLCVGLLVWPFLSAASPDPALQTAPGAAGLQASATIPQVVLPAPSLLVFDWLGWVWGVGAAAGLALAVRDVVKVVRLKRRTVPLSAEEQAQIGAGLSAWTSKRAPRLGWCDALDSPAVLGFFGPIIALPPSQVASLADGQSQLVVLHELAHVRRGDDWWTFAGRVVLALTWVNPVAHWMWRELSLSREMACDEWVVRQTAAPVAYARCLADVAGLRTRARRLRLAASVTGRPGMLRRRILGVLALDAPSGRVVSLVAWLAPLGVCMVAAMLLQLPPLVVVEHPRETPVSALAWAGSAVTASRMPVERPAGQPEAEHQPVPERRASVQRRPVVATEVPGGTAVTDEAPIPAPAAPDMSVEQAEAADVQLIDASPLPGVGTLSVAAAASVPATFPPQGGAARWWSGPAALGQATGGAAATAGRATASFFVRIGSQVPQLLKR
jgi:beta-lactamase regulating signal transducer with metallopeptidase domain